MFIAQYPNATRFCKMSDPRYKRAGSLAPSGLRLLTSRLDPKARPLP